MSTPSAVAGRYRIDERLGAGGMSTVFLAHDTVLERPVAVKLLAEHLAEDEAFVARFRREALAAARLSHPNIVQVFDSGEDESSGRHYIVMEYVDGPSGADLLRTEGTLDIDETVSVIRDACHGLDYAHRAGVVHRDVKPGNLLVAAETGAVKIADFGIAKAAEQTRITQVGAVLGTAAYLSPEQAKGEEAGPASDIYSLGVCAYQFLTGRLPHEYGSLTELALKQQNDAIVPIMELRPETPPELDRAVRLCLERDPSTRYGNALDLAGALEAGLRGEETAATQVLADADATQALPYETESTRALPVPPPPPPPGRPRTDVRPAPVDPRRREAERAARRRRRINAVIATVIALLAAVAVVLALQISSSGGGAENIDNDNVPDQVDQLIEYIRDHRE